MSLMPEVHDALARAVATRPPRWRRRRSPSRSLTLLFVGVLLISGTAFAATRAWHPILGSDKAPRPLSANSGVPADQVAALAILRRPQTDADRGPLVQKVLHVLSRNQINGIHVDGIRVIFQNPRELVMLVPAERFGIHERGLQEAGIHQSRLPNVLCLVSTSYSRAQSLPTRTQFGEPQTWRIPAGFRSVNYNCGGLDVLRSTGIQTITTTDGSGSVRTAPFTGIRQRRVVLVPDGVAKVRVRLRHRKRLMLPVHDNTYRYTINDSPFLTTTLWYDSDGHRIAHRARGRETSPTIGLSAPMEPIRR